MQIRATRLPYEKVSIVHVRRRSAFVVSSALAVSLVAGGALAVSGAEPAVAASGPDAFEITFKPEWVNTGWTVPETVDGVEVTIAGAPGRGPDGGAGAAFTFHTDAFVPGRRSTCNSGRAATAGSRRSRRLPAAPAATLASRACPAATARCSSSARRETCAPRPRAR
ncbi:hypothetical protein MN032_06720 [Agromyces atrinae]|nr:hypothetical protein [Agromyces atrinae]MCI2957377.1 hypothetical protein [Agromyces atrinae]